MIDVTTARIRNFHALARNSLPSLEVLNGGTLTPPTQESTVSLLNQLKTIYPKINSFMIVLVHSFIIEFPVSADSQSVGPGFIPLTYFNNA